MLMSEKITLFIAAWMIITFLLTMDTHIEIFFILIFIGFLIVIIFTERFALNRFKYRMNIIIFILLIVFIIIIGKTIINFLNI